LTDSDKRLELTKHREEALTAHTAVIGTLWRVLEHYRIDPARVIPDSLYRPGAYIADNSYVRLQDYYEIRRKVINAIDDEAVGLTMASLMHPSHLGVFGHAWIASPSVIASCRMLQRFGRVSFGDLRVELREYPHAIELSYDTDRVSPFPEAGADAQIGGLVKFCRMQYGESFKPASIALRRAVPENRAKWDGFFGVPVEFGSKENIVRIDPVIANEVLTTAHSALFEKHSKTLEKSSAELESSNLVTHVRLAIQQLLPSGTVAEDRVARIIDVNSRTLHRRLSEDGETFRSLLKDVRMDLAKRHLVKDGYNVTDVAFMLGYSDSSAFSRAFKSWFGVSPSEFRSTGTANMRGAVDRGL
jgi:AraC-like DNA-binding protein